MTATYSKSSKDQSIHAAYLMQSTSPSDIATFICVILQPSLFIDLCLPKPLVNFPPCYSFLLREIFSNMFSPSWSQSYSLVLSFFPSCLKPKAILAQIHISRGTTCDKKKNMYGVSELHLYRTVLGNIKFQLTDAKEHLYDDSNVTHKRSSTALLRKQTS